MWEVGRGKRELRSMKEQACGMIGYDAAIGQIEKARNQGDQGAAHFPRTVKAEVKGGDHRRES